MMVALWGCNVYCKDNQIDRERKDGFQNVFLVYSSDGELTVVGQRVVAKVLGNLYQKVNMVSQVQSLFCKCLGMKYS